MSPPHSEPQDAPDGLLFITGTTLEDFKSRKNMTSVRKKAMGSYLKERKPRGSRKEQSYGSEVGSVGSRSSVSSDHQDVSSQTELSMLTIGNGDRRKSSQSTSLAGSPESQQQVARRKDSPVARRPKMTVDFVLPSAPIVIPSRTGVLLPYDQTSPKPFQSIGKPLDPFRTIFQASHPQVSVEELKFYCSRSFGTKAMGMHWIPILLNSPHAYLSTLCIASAHLDAINERAVESVQTLALRQEVMHLISQKLLDPESRGDDGNVIALTQLLASEIIAGEDMTLHFHENGIKALIRQKGGMETLGANGRVATTLTWVSLESAILREAKPHPQYIQYAMANSTRSYPNTATIPESPLYCPRNEFETLKRSPKCTPQALELLKDIRMLMDLFLQEQAKPTRHDSLSLRNIHKKITTQYPTLNEIRKRRTLTTDDWRYEAIRITAILTATAISHRTPLSKALKQVPKSDPLPAPETPQSDTLISPTTLRQDSPIASNPFTFTPSKQSSSYRTSSQSSIKKTQPSLLSQLKLALSNSNLSSCWSDAAGVLLWIALTAGAAANVSSSPAPPDGNMNEENGGSCCATKVEHRWFKALALRVSIVLCFEHPEAVVASLLRMGWVGEGLAGNATVKEGRVTKRRA